MAIREGQTSKLKLVMTYQDETGAEKQRSKTYNNMKANQAPDNILAAGNAISSLQQDPADEVREITESIIKP